MATIEILPRTNMLDGRMVYETDDDYQPLDLDFCESVEKLIFEYGKTLVVDLNGFRSNRPRLDIIRMFEKKPIWVDAGVRLADVAIDIFIGGAEKTVLRTATLASMEELRKAHELSDQLVFQIDVLDGRIVGAEEFEAWSPRDLLMELARIGILTCLYVEQGRSVPGPSILHGLPDGFELYVGPYPASDAIRFEGSGFKGILVDGEELL